VTRPRRKLLPLAALLLAAAIAQGCRPAEERLPRRLFDGAEAPLYSRDAMSVLESVAVAGPVEATSPVAWTVGGTNVVTAVRSGGRSLASSDGNASLALPMPVVAAEVDRIEVVLRGIQAPSRPTLTWRIRGEAACGDCSLKLMARDGGGAERDHFGFEVGSHPRWRGVIENLTLQPTNLRAVEVGIESFAFQRRRVDAATDRDGAHRATVVYTTAHEARVARLLWPGEALRLPIVAARGETLRFAFGREPAATQAATVEVGATVAGVRQVLQEIQVPAEAGWQERRIDLSPLAGAAAELDFQIAGGGALDLDEAVFLGDPEILPPVAATRRPNVVLISIDTLRADRLSLYGNSRETSPNLEALAARGAVVFDLAVAAAVSTLPAHASMFTGLEVLRHGAYLDRPLAPGQTLLAERFRDAGFRTLAITGGGYVHPRFGLAQGFDRFRFWPRGEVDDGAELRDGLATLESWLSSEAERPFFLFFHTYEVHAPYGAREPYFSRWTGAPTRAFMQPWSRGDRPDEGYFAREHWPRVFGEGTPRDMRPDEMSRLTDLYDSGVANADAAIGEIVRMLAAAGISERTLLVVTADHGESLGERGFFDHGFLYDTNLLVPLVVFDPRHPAPGRRVGEQVRQIDIAPTLMELAALPADPGLDGESLVARLRGTASAAAPPAWSYAPETNHGIGLRKAGLKFIERDAVFPLQAGDDWEAYRLSEDRTESQPLASLSAASLAQLRAAVTAKLEKGHGAVLLEWSNRSDAEVAGLLHWSALRPQSVKWAGAKGARFEMPAPGTLRFVLPARTVSRVRVQGLVDTLDYRLQITAPVGLAEAAGSVPLATLCQGAGSLFSNGGVPAGTRIAFDLTARADLACDGAEVLAEDPELTARLKALGYLQ